MKQLEISGIQPVSSSAKERTDTNKKLAYTSPVFQIYGPASNLTMGSTGAYGDGSTGKRSAP